MKGVCIKDLSPTLFLFQFFHELDLKRAIKGGPWTFNQRMLVISRLKVGDNPSQVPLDRVDFWIQVHDVPYGFMSKKVGKDIGNYLKCIWRNYM